MIKKILVGVMFYASAVNASDDVAKLDNIIEILKFVESENNPKALGDYRQGKPTAFGVLQIRPIAIKDVNRIYKTNYTIKDALSVSKSEEIFKLYINFWVRHINKKTGRKITTELIVRTWNGGPTGYKKSSTIWYHKKFLRYKNKPYFNNMAQAQMCTLGNKVGMMTRRRNPLENNHLILNV